MKKVIAATSRKRKQDRSRANEEQVPDDEPVSVKASGKKGSSTQDKSFSFSLSDPDVLDCPICFNPFTTPVYQCENGHVACSVCCSRILEKKCASCFLPIGSIRNRALEKVLESVKVPCANAEYGCTETLRYSDKSGHESQCNFVPCSCPHSDCDFVSSFSDLPAHHRTEHGSSASVGVRFLYDKPFKVTLNSDDDDDDVTILQEVNGGKLFIVKNFVAGLGNAVSVFCIQPELLPNYRCQISAKSNGCSLVMNSFTKNTQNSAVSTIISSRFLLIPTDYFGAGQPRAFEICIFRSYE